MSCAVNPDMKMMGRLGTHPREGSGELAPIHDRHPELGEDQIDSAAIRPRQAFERGGAFPASSTVYSSLCSRRRIPILRLSSSSTRRIVGPDCGGGGDWSLPEKEVMVG